MSTTVFAHFWHDEETKIEVARDKDSLGQIYYTLRFDGDGSQVRVFINAEQLEELIALASKAKPKRVKLYS